MSSSGGSSGGGAPNAVKVRKFPFAYNLAGLNTGVALYTPTVGDILLDAWFEIGTAWNGTTPHGDFGTFPVASHTGFFKETGGQDAVDMTAADSLQASCLEGTLAGNTWGSAALFAAAIVGTLAQDDIYAVSGSSISIGTTPVKGGSRLLPGKFTAATPIKVCVSQDGTTTGADPGATQGAAVLYLVTATPA